MTIYRNSKVGLTLLIYLVYKVDIPQEEKIQVACNVEKRVLLLDINVVKFLKFPHRLPNKKFKSENVKQLSANQN